jgi:cellulose synthase/poly-beta-1,6-N-acetylglucosamine synthase-like glycosyltransferase
MNTLLVWLLGSSILLVLYTYLGYPLVLRVLAARRAEPGAPPDPDEWPRVSIAVPAHNEADQIQETIECLLALDYPRDRRQILIVSDASTDGTDEIVARFADRGVELLRMPTRVGKTGVENQSAEHLTGEIVVNSDASVRLHPLAIRHLVRAFSDPGVGVASGRDVSITGAGEPAEDPNVGESGYVGYEMRVRRLESRVRGIVGASGSIYAIRAHLHRSPLPDDLSRDFSAALLAEEAGLRTVSVDEALAYVPRAPSLRREYRRKVRTMTRGMQTLLHRRYLLNPARHGIFSWMLFSHKVCRWLVPWVMLVGLVALAGLALSHAWAARLLALALLGVGLGTMGIMWPDEEQVPRALVWPAYALAGNVAGLHAALRVLRGDADPTWEPTRRER